MKTLYLLRHAKSRWGKEFPVDFDRPLAPRGRKAAARMGRELRTRGFIPDFVLCSQARRAAETWQLVAPELGAAVPARILRSLYLAPPRRLLALLQRQPDTLRSVMQIGHNPGMERLAVRLSGPDSSKGALHQLREKYPTAALAVITFETGRWSGISAGAGRLTHFLRPRELG